MIRRRWAINLILLIILVVLGVAVQHDLNSPASVPVLADVIADDLQLITIARNGEPTIRIERNADGHWRMREPQHVDANQEKIDELLKVLDTPVHRTFPAVSANLHDLGLAPARIHLHFDALDLAFGNTDPVNRDRYVSSEGLVYLINDRFYPLLIAPPRDYISPYLLPRSYTPAFGSLDGIPLAKDVLEGLTRLKAERIDPRTEQTSGSQVFLKDEDGRSIEYLLSEDHRQWIRPDLRLGYVLSDPPILTEDPDAVDDTPPATPFDPPSAATADSQKQGTDTDPFGPDANANRILPGDIPLGPPPSVRLQPGEHDQGTDDDSAVGYGAEPYKERPQGFGQDPFAPDSN